MVEREAPALVLLDYMMPGLDGMTALREIRERFPDTCIIMYTGKGSEEIAVELMKAGATDYILKPFNNQDLLDRIDHALQLRRFQMHNRELREERERLLREIEEWNLELERRVEEKSRELQRAHAEMVQAEKLVTLGHLSAGMAHEIRNPLNSISLFAQLIRSAADDAELATHAGKILNEVDRIDDILIKLLSTSKRSRFNLRQVDLPEVVERVLGTFHHQALQQGVEVELELRPPLPSILADTLEVEQIFSNLVANSLYEMPHGGRLSVQLASGPKSLLVTIADSGGGIAKEDIGRIFEPFFTTKAKGTGFGLSVVLRIVKTYGGRIRVESEEGKGATFMIELPLTAGSDE
jgi:hypothetical protein